MNPKILEILPKKTYPHDPRLALPPNERVRNKTIDEVTEALNKHNVCLCPSEEEIRSIISSRVEYHYSPREDCYMIGSPKELTKAIRKLMMGDEK